MGNEFFQEFKFTEPQYKEIIVSIEPNVRLRTISTNDRQPVAQIETVTIDLFEEGDVTCAKNVKTVDEVMPDFEGTLADIGQTLGCQLTTEKRELLLVPMRDLRPKTEGETNRLVDRYGKYAKNGGDGDCTLLGNGVYRLRVGLRKTPGMSSKPIVLEIAAHEYGHTLGAFDALPPTYEEMKAYAFASLFQRFFYGETEYEEPKTDLMASRPHDIAIHRLGELLRKGVPEGAVISHLIGQRLGRFGPNDYRGYLKYDQPNG